MTCRRAASFFALAAVAAVVVLPSGLFADGTIQTAGATIDSGAGTPKGAVTIDASAPPAAPPTIAAVPAIGSIGAIDGAMPAFGGAGAGGLGAANFTSDASLAGGTYEFATYTIASNVGVTYSGPVTIKTTGDMTFDGGIRTTADGASVTLVCGGNLTIAAHIGGATEGVETVGANAPVIIDVNGTITTSSSGGTTSLVRSLSGDVTILQHGAAAPMTLGRLDVDSPTALIASSAGSISTSASSFTADVVGLRALGGDTTCNGSTFFGGSNTYVHSSGTTTIVNGGQVRSNGGVDVAALAGDVVLDATSVAAGSANSMEFLTLRAGRDVTLQNAPVVTCTGHRGVSIRAFGGAVSFEPFSPTKQTKLQNLEDGTVYVQASSDVSVGGQTLIDSPYGATFAAGGNVFLRDACQLHASLHTLDVSASGSVTATGGQATATGGWMYVRAGASVSLDVGSVQGGVGSLTIAATTNIALRGTYSSTGAMRVAALGGGVDVAGATLLTFDNAPSASGSVVVESFHEGATIDASNASVKSGAAGTAKSGDVSLLVHRAPVFDGYLLPSKVALKIGKTSPAASTITVAGTLDMGNSATDLSGDATLTVGDLALPVSLVKDAKGRYRGKTTTSDFSVVPPKTGSSRANFTLKAVGDFGAVVAAAGEGPLPLRFAHPQLDARGQVTLTTGKYADRKKRAALVAPNLALLRAKATIVGAGGDALDLAVAFATDGTTPAAAPDVVVSFGPTFTVSVPSATFGAAKKGAFKALNPAAGVLSVTLDYAHETIAVKAKKTDLGAIATSAGVPVDVVVSFGADARTVKTRLGGKGTKTAY
jgi:hypothetical protein